MEGPPKGGPFDVCLQSGQGFPDPFQNFLVCTQEGTVDGHGGGKVSAGPDGCDPEPTLNVALTAAVIASGQNGAAFLQANGMP